MMKICMERINEHSARRLRMGIYLLFFAAFFCMFYFGLRDVLQGWEAHSPLFRYSKDYFESYRHEPQSLLMLSNAFLVQFSYYPALGALIYAGLFTLLAYCINVVATPKTTEDPADTVTTQVLHKPIVAGFAVAAALLPSFSYLFCLWPLIVVSITVGALVWKATSTFKPWHIIFRFFYLAGLVVFLREYILIACLSYMLIDIFAQTPPSKKGTQIALTVLLTIVYSCIVFRIEQPYDFYNARTRPFILLFHDACNVFLEPFSYFKISRLARLFLFVALIFWLFLLFSPLVRKVFKRVKAKRIISFFLSLWVLCSMVISLSIAEEQSRFFKADALCREQRWHEALKILEKSYEKHSSKRKLNKSSVLYDAQLKTCLLALRRATDQIFTYNLITFPLLFPDHIGSGPEAYALPPYYFYCGNYSENLHLNYDCVTGRSINPVILEGIIETSLVVGDTLPASKFVHMLRQSLFRGKRAVAIFEGKDSESAERIKRGKKFLVNDNYAVNGYAPDVNQMKNSSYRPQNIYLYEYFLAVCLLYKDTYMIVRQFDQIKKFYPRGIPRHIQEGYLATYNYAPSRLSYPYEIEGIDSETWADYWNFVMDDQAYQAKRMPFDELEKKWRHTFWFYHLYMVRDNKQTLIK